MSVAKRAAQQYQSQYHGIPWLLGFEAPLQIVSTSTPAPTSLSLSISPLKEPYLYPLSTSKMAGPVLGDQVEVPPCL